MNQIFKICLFLKQSSHEHQSSNYIKFESKLRTNSSSKTLVHTVSEKSNISTSNIVLLSKLQTTSGAKIIDFVCKKELQYILHLHVFEIQKCQATHQKVTRQLILFCILILIADVTCFQTIVSLSVQRKIE